ncbi:MULTISPECIES: restriction endonuclease [Aphanizomenonaceae]|uniref:Restriction endonuclease n=1 Tax=Dolichospermum heterosporum TAC447 TaxID=747523 RepID=A0ABY5LVE9_9CYAN|nr:MULTISPECIES: restriction endonuclease [Aphanizomenonaceae]UUO15978.1 restriction endonuclease [Dolichospermum heterosporum TAC447]
MYLDGEEIEQIDGVVYADGLSCIIECKDTAKPVKIEPIAKLRNQLLRRPAATIGSIFSRSGFTEASETLAGFVAPQTILLWGGEEIKYSGSSVIFMETLVQNH